MELEWFQFLLIIVTILGCTCAVNISTTEKINHSLWFYHENMKSNGTFMIDRYRKDAIEYKEYMNQLNDKWNILLENNEELRTLFEDIVKKEQSQK